ncbi:unnamed protein product, partial [Dicrocoelium dendriticum]
MAAVIPEIKNSCEKPELIFKIDGFSSDVNSVLFLPGKECIITGTDDRSLRVWMKRDSSRFWPSAMEILPSDVETSCIFAGLDNGTVMEFVLAEDLNHMKHKRDYLPHTAKVTGVIHVFDRKWLLSVSKDQTVACYSTETGKCLAGHQLEAPGTCLQYDNGSRYIFVGDTSGGITLLGLNESSGQVECRTIRELRAQEQTITSLSWDRVNSRLFSSSADRTVILWDIGGAKGLAFKLQGHSKDVSAVLWWADGNSRNTGDLSMNAGLAISGGLDGLLVFWRMDPSRTGSPPWCNSDVCQICGTPFFWNVKKMWNVMAVGVRQHHCRRCGKAVCDKCSPFRSSLPTMGFERDVRMCNVCSGLITDA